MATTPDLKIDGLSFPEIKENLKAFLRSQNQFKDYNFDSSGLSTLLDILAYNTYYNSFYLNMVSSETFLATAQRRNNVVQLARSLNYIPRSTSSAKLKATFSVDPVGTPNSVTIPKYTSFEANSEDGRYFFLTDAVHTIAKDNSNNYIMTDINLIEGKYVVEKYIKDTTDVNQRFILNNTTIDTNTLVVRIINSVNDSTVRIFTRADNLVNLDENSQVYFLEEVEDGKYEIFFGDGDTGVALTDGNLIYIEYLVSSGVAGNNIQSIQLASTVPDVLDITATVTTPSYGGDDKEDIERIRFNAPKAYAAQNRLVTTDDYLSLVLRQPNVQSAIVWGGEDNDPPQYGRVYIAVQPKLADVLTDSEKTDLVDYIIRPKKLVTVNVEIVDPEYIYIVPTVSVKYDAASNVLNTTNLKTIITNNIIKYNSENLSQFSRYFRYSGLTRAIDNSERSIKSSTIKIQLRREVVTELGSNTDFTINFANPIDNTTESRPDSHPYGIGFKLTSNEFTYQGLGNCYLEDNGGKIRIYRKIGSTILAVKSNVGAIDYGKGIITLNQFSVDAFTEGGATLKIFVTPREQDILPLRSSILVIKESDISVTLIDDNSISLVKR